MAITRKFLGMAGSPVSESDRSPLAYGGTIKKVEIRIAPAALSAEEQKVVRDAERQVAKAID